MTTTTPTLTLLAPSEPTSLLTNVIVASDRLEEVARSAKTLARVSGLRVVMYETSPTWPWQDAQFEATTAPLFDREVAARVIAEVFPSGRVHLHEVE